MMQIYYDILILKIKQFKSKHEYQKYERYQFIHTQKYDTGQYFFARD